MSRLVKVGSGILVIGFGEPLDKIFEDVAHVNGLDLLRRHVGALRAEVAHHLVQQRCIRIAQALNLAEEIHARQNVLHVFGKTVEVVLEVVLDVGGVGLERLEGELGCVVEGVTGCLSEETVLDGKVLVLLCGFHDLPVRWQQAVVKTFNDRHGQDDEAVLVGLVGTAQRVRNVPG